MEEYKLYIGTKIIKAVPMMHSDYLNSIGKPFESNQVDEEGYQVMYDNNYKSWSPRNVFDIAYREITDSEKEFLK
jgi:hypothetical protein